MSDENPPAGYRNINVCLVVKDARAAMDFYRLVFDARESFRIEEPTSGRIAHAEMLIGDSVLMLTDPFPEVDAVEPEVRGPFHSFQTIYVPDPDLAMERAFEAGARVLTPVIDHYYGDRAGQFQDPFGHVWTIAQKLEAITPEEMQTRFLKMLEELAADEDDEYTAANDDLH